MTAKDQNLYKAVLNDIRKLIPQFQPEVTMSDWEAAPRNAVKEIYPNVKNYGCWFHFSQRVNSKTRTSRDFHREPGVCNICTLFNGYSFSPK